MRIYWHCNECGKEYVSNSKIRNNMDICSCGHSGVDVEEFYQRSFGYVIIDKVEKVEKDTKTNKKLYIINGKKGSGKDELTRCMNATCVVKMSNKLKEMCTKIFMDKEFGNICPSIYEGDFFEDKKEIHRFLLQRVGTDIAREIKNNVWVDAAIEEIIKKFESNNIIVVNDIRFKNEVDLIEEFCDDENIELVKIKINRDNVEGDIHKSEQFDFIDNTWIQVDNNGTIEDLEERAKEIIEKGK